MGQYRNISRFTPNRSWEQIKRRNQIVFSWFWNWRWHRNDFHNFLVRNYQIFTGPSVKSLKRIIDLVRAPWTSRDCSHPSATINQSRSNQVWNCQTAQLRRLEPLRSLVQKFRNFWNLRKISENLDLEPKLVPFKNWFPFELIKAITGNITDSRFESKDCPTLFGSGFSTVEVLLGLSF